MTPDLEYTHCAPCPHCGRSVAAGTEHKCPKPCERCYGCGTISRCESDTSDPCPECHGTGIDPLKKTESQ